MENNEDNRQMTVLQELLILVDRKSLFIEDEYNDGPDYNVIKFEDVKALIESLLPKERSMIVDAFDNGQANYSAPRDFEDGKQYFGETFKPYKR
jgi:hypothetical protein